MIGKLSGILLEKEPPFLLIDVKGVGYELQSSITTMSMLAKINQPITVYVHMVTRKDLQNLYGFSTKTERLLFRLLIKGSGVGPKMALGILSGMSVEDFVGCVDNKEVDRLTKIPGVGKKTAERLVIELRDKLKKQLPQGVNFSSDKGSKNRFCEYRVQEDAISALEVLGYKSNQARQVVSNIDMRELDCAELVRLALKELHTA